MERISDKVFYKTDWPEKLNCKFFKYSKPFVTTESEERQDPTEPDQGPNKIVLDLQGVLNLIREPRYFKEQGKQWKQVASCEQVSRAYVQKMLKKIDCNFGAIPKRRTCFCLPRRVIYDEVFDEVIRQVTLECPERGLLLLRIRSEIRACMDLYEYRIPRSIEIGRQLAYEVDWWKHTNILVAVVNAKNKLRKLRRMIEFLEGECEELDCLHDAKVKYFERMRKYYVADLAGVKKQHQCLLDLVEGFKERNLWPYD